MHSMTWRDRLAQRRAACEDSAEVEDVDTLVQNSEQRTLWYKEIGTGNIVNSGEVFFGVRAYHFRIWVGGTWVEYLHPMLDYRKQDPGYIVLFTDSRMERVIVQAKFGGGNPGASLLDPLRESKKGMLVAPTFEASASNLKAGVTAVGNAAIVHEAIARGELMGPEIIQDENRFCLKRNGEQVLVLNDERWEKAVQSLAPREFVVTLEELIEIVFDGDSGAGHGGRARSEANEHLAQVFGIFMAIRHRRMFAAS